MNAKSSWCEFAQNLVLGIAVSGLGLAVLALRAL
jgi:hypothetical protein